VAIHWLLQATLKARNTIPGAPCKLKPAPLPTAVARVRFELQAQALPAARLRWHVRHYDAPATWQLNVSIACLTGSTNFQAIEWLDRQYRMRWIEAAGGNEE